MHRSSMGMGYPQKKKMHEAGFTLMELLVVICIIVIATAIAAPAIGEARAEQRVVRAAQSMIRIGRRARSEALGYGRAHVVRYSTASAGGSSQGSMMLYRGVTSTCNNNNWTSIFASPPCGAANSMCIDSIDLGDTEYNTSTHTTWMSSPAYGYIDICYQTNGAVLHREAPTARFSDLNTIAGGFVFNVNRQVSGAQEGVTRTVIFPLGGVPRLFR